MKHINPTNEQTTSIETFPINDISNLLDDLNSRSFEWKYLNIAERVNILRALPTLIENEEENLIHLAAQEMGKPVAIGRIEIQRTIEESIFYLDHAEEFLKNEPLDEDNGYIEFQGLGTVAVISPWNFPFMLPLRGILPALLAGNAVVFKPSELTPKCGKALTDLFYRCNGTLSKCLKLVIGGKEHGSTIVQGKIHAVSFTGSTAVGKHIAKECANNLKKMTLELGGLDPAIVLKDADLDKTAQDILAANILNSGQVCNSIKRVFVQKEIAIDFINKIKNLSENVTCGNPTDDVQMGPIVSETQLKRIIDFVADAKSMGATILTGGERIERSGYFYPSTIVTNVNNKMKLMNDEAFGPILPIQIFDDIEDAIELSNSTKYGLTASIWTKDLAKGKEISKRLDFGIVSINNHKPGKPGYPWGGTKESGIGRMKTKEGMRELTNTKLVKYDS